MGVAEMLGAGVGGWGSRGLWRARGKHFKQISPVCSKMHVYQI